MVLIHFGIGAVDQIPLCLGVPRNWKFSLVAREVKTDSSRIFDDTFPSFYTRTFRTISISSASYKAKFSLTSQLGNSGSTPETHKSSLPLVNIPNSPAQRHPPLSSSEYFNKNASHRSSLSLCRAFSILGFTNSYETFGLCSSRRFTHSLELSQALPSLTDVLGCRWPITMQLKSFETPNIP